MTRDISALSLFTLYISLSQTWQQGITKISLLRYKKLVGKVLQWSIGCIQNDVVKSSGLVPRYVSIENHAIRNA